MSGDFQKAYDQLNDEQRQAVDYIDGPLLVLAGPGTGKTQLLSARVANILNKTDIDAGNILCLTFTENGAQNMRERLKKFIGDAAYDVTISTYHSFGSDIIKNYSEYFQQIGTERSDDVRMERPIDELTQIQIVGEIVGKLPFDSPLLSARYYIKAVVGTISDLKQNLITPDKLRAVASDNIKQIEAAQAVLDEVLNHANGLPTRGKERALAFESLQDGLSDLKGDLVEQATAELAEAAENGPTFLTKWKEAWLHKDANDNFTLTETGRSQKMFDLADVYEKYQAALNARAAYDFDDMILRAIAGLKDNDELRFNLQERFQYILLDEFQDTNPSQFELVKRIADHPVHEGRPNIMAVGDDDQAIFAFQGAHIGNMKDFLQAFRGVKTINLTQNYRSHSDIIHVAHNIASQISDRLHNQLNGIEKILEAASDRLPENAIIARHNFAAEASEYSWIARNIAALIERGTDPSEIAVLSPKHALLEGLVPFLHSLNIPVRYEKRENILETEIVQGLRLAAQLLQALNSGDTQLANQYFPRVLNLAYWQIPAIDIWKINWQLAKWDEKRTWAEIALESPVLEPAVSFYLRLASTATTEPLEITLDKLAGTLTVSDAGRELTAPLKDYYFSTSKRATDALEYYESISHLSVIRSHLRDHQASSEQKLGLSDFLNFFVMYESAEMPLINSHPIAQAKSAVQLMTAYKAKGLEFEHVFIIQAHDDVWGKSSRGGGNKLSLPKNLEYIRYAGSGDNERLRLFFVAVSRAKYGLYITSHSNKDNGKANVALKYLSEDEEVSAYLPETAQKIINDPTDAEQLAADIEKLWQAGHVHLPADFRALLEDRVKSYQMSPTHLNTFVDMEWGGPEAFMVNTLLRFPSAPGADGEYGTAIHNTLEWYQNQLNAGSATPAGSVLERYDYELGKRYLSVTDRDLALAKGRASLTSYLQARGDMFKLPAKAEVNFRSEGVTIGEAHLSGKIDRLEVDEQAKTVDIVDYKTGRALTKWDSSMKSYKYRQQLYFYKLLIEGSNSWKGYSVASARLEFVEPSGNPESIIQPPLKIDFDPAEEEKLKNLIKVVWDKIQTLDLPDTSSYSADTKGTRQFEADLLSENS